MYGFKAEMTKIQGDLPAHITAFDLQTLNYTYNNNQYGVCISCYAQSVPEDAESSVDLTIQLVNSTPGSYLPDDVYYSLSFRDVNDVEIMNYTTGNVSNVNPGDITIFGLTVTKSEYEQIHHLVVTANIPE